MGKQCAPQRDTFEHSDCIPKSKLSPGGNVVMLYKMQLIDATLDMT